jgi:hypothetical protein
MNRPWAAKHGYLSSIGVMGSPPPEFPFGALAGRADGDRK